MPVASNLHWEQIPITPFPTKTKTADVSGCWWIIVDYHFEPKGTKCGFCSSTCKPLKNWFALPQAWEPPQFLSGSRHWHWTSTWTALFEKGYNKTTCQNTCKQKNTTLFHLFLNHSSKKKKKKVWHAEEEEQKKDKWNHKWLSPQRKNTPLQHQAPLVIYVLQP